MRKAFFAVFPVAFAIILMPTISEAQEQPCGIFLTNWGSLGSGDGEFNTPSGVAVDGSGNVYVADRQNARIQKFDSNGGFITKWGSPGSGNGEFSNLFGIAVDGSGNVYVTDPGNDRIQKFDSNGGFITKWGSPGSGLVTQLEN